MLEYKQKRNNGRTPFAGVYKFVCVCVCEEKGFFMRFLNWLCQHNECSLESLCLNQDIYNKQQTWDSENILAQYKVEWLAPPNKDIDKIGRPPI